MAVVLYQQHAHHAPRQHVRLTPGFPEPSLAQTAAGVPSRREQRCRPSLRHSGMSAPVGSAHHHSGADLVSGVGAVATNAHAGVPLERGQPIRVAFPHSTTVSESQMLREPLRTRAPRPAALQYVTQTLFTTNTGPLRGRLPTSAPFTRPSRDRRNQANERITHAQWRRLQHWSQPERVPSLRPLHSIVYAPPR